MLRLTDRMLRPSRKTKRRIFAALSINITRSFSALKYADVNKTGGSILNANYPPKWVNFACLFTERTEETSLLPEDEARRLPLEDIIMVVDAQMPIRAKRIQYYDDRFFKGIHAAQKGELPFPSVSLGSYEPPAADGAAEPEYEPDGPNNSQHDSGTGAVVAQQAENLSVAEASVKPHRTTIRTPKRKRQAKAVVYARQDIEQRQTELDLSVQRRLDLPEPGTVAESDIEALLAADAELAELEMSFSEGQGGLTSTAAE